MVSYKGVADAHPSSFSRKDACALPQTTSNGPSMSAMLMDPRAHKAHLSNGNPSFTTHHEMDPPYTRGSSEPGLASSLDRPSLLGSPKFTAKDDAHDFLKGQGRAAKNSNHEAMVQPAQSFDPRQLLDPKGTRAAQRGPSPKQNSRSSHGLHKRESEEPEAQGMGNLIERIHGITQREGRPQKRQKTDASLEDEEEQRKATFAGGGKGGEIGEYMREQRKEAQAKDGPDDNVVDLTAGDDNEVVVIGEVAVQDREVCYGLIALAKVQAHMIPNPSKQVSYYGRSHWPTMKLELKRHPGKDNIIRVIDPTERDFGNVDVRTSLGLARLMDSRKDSGKPLFRLQARLNLRRRSEKEVPYQACSSYFDMTLNLYGPESRVKAVGTHLSQKNIFLQTPFNSDSGIEVCNPHAKETPKIKATTSGSGSSREAGYVYRTAEEVRSEVLGMFDSLETSETMPEMEPDPSIFTPLLPHQKQGLWFMTEKEKDRVFSDKEEDNNSLWRLKINANGRRTYYNVITGREERHKPLEVLGGILADMMGLGKTLSILSLVVDSLDQALAWVEQIPPDPEAGDIALVQNAKTTLLIAPLSTMANWEEQIRAHIKPGTLTYHLYHGSNRTTDLKELAKYDMIITTYSIVSSEYNRRSRKRDVSPLFQLNFFRIVLDEAHMIREQSTMQSQAICKLSAQRRWAVTGTPVQNRLDDLGALIKFLRIQPFEKQGFALHILTPFKNADPDILPKLRLLVDSVTLRRLKDKIDLPPRNDVVARLEFSDDEALLYDWFMKDSSQKAKAIAGGKQGLGGKSYVHILRAILRLRLICAHGRELLSEEDLKMTEGFNANNAIDLSDDDDAESDIPVMNDRQVYEMLMLFKETDGDTCAQCLRKIGSKDDDGSPGPKEGVIGYMLPCFQLVCRDCFKDVKQVIDTRTVNNDGRFTCPLCDQYLRGAPFELTQAGIDAVEDAKALARDNPRHSKILGRYGGPHTKTKALVSALLASQEESKALLEAGEPPIKSVVFSGWTTHLDLIQIALNDAGLRYVRLDGKMTRQKRNASLDAFRDDPGTTIFLISLMAGGLGLNLTTGSKVYVMEPQFNPAAEAQAVDRVHRLGQKREVTCTRFIMKDSFEENMLKLQRKKQNLADLSMSRGKLDKAEAAKQRLEELRSLFR